MDKYEYNLKIDQMKSLFAEENYEAAAELADTINWNKIKNVNALVKAGEVYEMAERYQDSREVLLMAYDRSPIGRMIIYRLAEVAIKMKDVSSAEEYYKEFVQIAPHDSTKYVLKYNIQKAKGASYGDLIPILEEFKEQEYTEEWAYELAYLYHKSGKSDKCIDACDELILWFGDGPYVERALELKMLYQPLTKIQESKYRRFRQEREGMTEIGEEEMKRAGEFVHDPVVIPQVAINEKFNTVNLQEEIVKGMQQIMDATEKETVSDTMDNIKKIVEEIPYLQLPKEEEDMVEREHIETDEEIDGSLKINFQEMIGEDYDGQMSLMVDDKAMVERQITGQMSIEDVLEEWERTKRAAETAMQEAEQRRLESAKARALQEAEDIMDRLNDVIPKLDAGISPQELLAEQYMQGTDEPIDVPETIISAVAPVVDTPEISDIPDISDVPLPGVELFGDEQEIPETEEMVEIAEEILPQMDVPGMDELVAPEADLENVEEIPVNGETNLESVPELSLDDIPEITLEPEINEEPEVIQEPKIPEEPEAKPAVAETMVLPNLETIKATQEEKKLAMGATKKLPPIKQRTQRLPEIAMPEDLDIPEEVAEIKHFDELTEDQKAIFSYFVPVKGMEDQLCKAINGISTHLVKKEAAKIGNVIVQGDQGCGKTMLATSLIKVLQKETGMPNGKVGKIDAASLNNKDVQQLVRKVSGGCLIVEKAGDIDKKTATALSLLMEHDITGTLYIFEDTSKGIKKALSQDLSFATKFTEKITVPIFTNDELVSFAKSYSSELGYKIDDMAVLALYNRISNIQKLDQATTLTEVKEIVDEAIDREAHGGLRKAISILTAKRYTDDDRIVLTEANFDLK